METRPTPIIVVSASANLQDTTVAFTAIEAGALAVVERPRGIGHPEYEKTAAQLIETVKLMSEVPVVRRWARRGDGSSSGPRAAAGREPAAAKEVRAVAIGASTGGPPVLHKLVSGLRKDFPAPLLVVQHIVPGFSEGFMEWLRGSSAMGVRLATNGELAEAGQVYLAPDGFHLGMDEHGRLRLSAEPAENGHRPSVAHLFRSVAEACGAQAVGVLLTGMGKDGAAELKMMKEAGAITVAQDKESSIVHGMPGEAIRLGGASYTVSADGLAALLTRLVDSNKENPS
jgi:two-component system chemotaxis response regulator CheB